MSSYRCTDRNSPTYGYVRRRDFCIYEVAEVFMADP